MLKIFNFSTQYELEIDPDGHFKYMYMAVRAAIKSFLNFIRLLIVVDVAHIKEKYKGTTLVAASIDANMQIYLLCFPLGIRKMML